MPAKSKNIIGPQVRRARMQKKPELTQELLCELLGDIGITISRAGISKIETGERSVYDFEVKALAKVLGVTIQWLIEG